MAMFIWFIRTNVTLSHDLTTTIQQSAMSMNDNDDDENTLSR